MTAPQHPQTLRAFSACILQFSGKGPFTALNGCKFVSWELLQLGPFPVLIACSDSVGRFDGLLVAAMAAGISTLCVAGALLFPLGCDGYPAAPATLRRPLSGRLLEAAQLRENSALPASCRHFFPRRLLRWGFRSLGEGGGAREALRPAARLLCQPLPLSHRRWPFLPSPPRCQLAQERLALPRAAACVLMCVGSSFQQFVLYSSHPIVSFH